MEISFCAFNLDSESTVLAEWLSGQEWPFHVNSTVSVDKIMSSVNAGHFSGEENQTFWILRNQSERVGVIRLFEMDDLDDGAPLFDIRILSSYQGKGIGELAVKWLTRYLFDGWPKLNRVEGTTRADNLGMRKVFRKCGYLKEGHYRQSWPSSAGTLFDTVRYAILRQDWQGNVSTSVHWQDE